MLTLRLPRPLAFVLELPALPVPFPSLTERWSRSLQRGTARPRTRTRVVRTFRANPRRGRYVVRVERGDGRLAMRRRWFR